MQLKGQGLSSKRTDLSFLSSSGVFLQYHDLICFNLVPVRSSIPSRASCNNFVETSREDPGDQGLFVLHLARLGSSVNWGVRATAGGDGGIPHTWHWEMTFQNQQHVTDFKLVTDWSMWYFNTLRYYNNLSGFYAIFRMFWILRFDLWFQGVAGRFRSRSGAWLSS